MSHLALHVRRGVLEHLIKYVQYFFSFLNKLRLDFFQFSSNYLKNYCSYFTWTKELIWHVYPIIVNSGILIQIQMCSLGAQF